MSRGPFVPLLGRDAIEREIGRRMVTGKPALVPLLVGAHTGRFNVVEVPGPSQVLALAGLERIKGPTIVLVEEAARPDGGPDRWRCAAALRAWARGVFVLATEATPDHYLAALTGMAKVERLVLIETAPRYMVPWRTWFASTEAVVIPPPPGLITVTPAAPPAMDSLPAINLPAGPKSVQPASPSAADADSAPHQVPAGMLELRPPEECHRPYVDVNLEPDEARALVMAAEREVVAAVMAGDAEGAQRHAYTATKLRAALVAEGA